MEEVPYESHPLRCQYIRPESGQCMTYAVDYNMNCLAHGGYTQKKALENKLHNQYLLARYKTRLERHAGSDDLKSLRNEVALLRMILEDKINAVLPGDLSMNAGPISDLIMKIDKVVTSCNKLESAIGLSMDKTQLLLFAATIIQIIDDEVEDSTVKATIGTNIMKAVNETADDSAAIS